MAPAVKNTSVKHAFALAFGLTFMGGNALADPVPALPDMPLPPGQSCASYQTIANSASPSVPANAHHALSNIYGTIDLFLFDTNAGELSLLDTAQFRQMLTALHLDLDSPDNAELLDSELGKVDRFINQRDLVENHWNAIGPFHQILTMVETVMGVHAMRQLLGDVMGESGMEELLAGDMGAIEESLGFIDYEDYLALRGIVDCGITHEPLVAPLDKEQTPAPLPEPDRGIRHPAPDIRIA